MTRTLLRSNVIRSLAGRSRTSTVERTRLFLKTQLWAWPLIAAVGLGVLGWWVTRIIEREMKDQMRGSLKTILNADVTALRLWLETERDEAESLAMDERVEEATRDLVKEAAVAPGKPDDVPTGLAAEAKLRAILAERVKKLGFVDFRVIDLGFRPLAELETGMPKKVLSGYLREFVAKVLKTGPSVSRPYLSTVILKDQDGVERVGVPTMIAASAIEGADGKPVAVLCLRIRPEQEFSKILQIARSGQSGETYAFDKTGLLLTESRFDEQMKRFGLLADRKGERSILTLELRDPGVNMYEGNRPTKLRSEQPLTRMAAAAIAGGTGENVDGYRDYRGVPSISAWTWLDDYDMGVASEMDMDEAYGPLNVVRWTFRGLFGLLALAAVAIFAFTIVVARKQQEVMQIALAAKQLGQYKLEDKIGSGGMGSVYRAKHALLRRPTAIKMLDVDKISDSAVARFEREVQLTSALNHPNTIAIYDYGHTPEGLFYYAMEYLDGINLEDLVARHGPLPDGRVAMILAQVCGSLAEAHGVGLVHRDIKPANIILNSRGGQFDVVKVLDFGLVKAVGAEHEVGLTASNSLTGTPLYLSPEAIETPEVVDYRTDLYALGAVGYFLVTGTPVFTGKSIVDLCMQHVRTPPEPPSQRLGKSIAPRLEAVILRCLAKNREDRPESAQAIIDEMLRCVAIVPWTRQDAEIWWRTVGLAPMPVPPSSPSPSSYPTTIASGSLREALDAGAFTETVAVNRDEPA